MPYTRTPRGSRTQVSAAKISDTITKAYLEAHGPQAAPWRARIQKHAQSVWRALEKRLGTDPSVEWPRAAIAEAIETELRERADVDVHEAYLALHPPKAAKKPGTTHQGWDRFEAEAVVDLDRIDPVWSVQRPKERIPVAPAAASPLDGLGVPARPKKGRAAATQAVVSTRPPTRRSDWVAFWHQLSLQATHALDWEVFERIIVSQPPDHRHQSSEDWWLFWHTLLDQALLEEPRLYALWAVAESHRARARLVGADWLDGSVLGREAHPELLSYDGRTADRYRALWHEHMQRWCAKADADPRLRAYDLGRLAQALAPERDRLIDWRGWQQLMVSEGLWRLPSVAWQAQAGKPDAQAHELPQWAWMRLAMTLALEESDPTAWTLRFYEAVSTLSVVPSDTLLREAGAKHPRFLEDQSARVRDEFDNIQTAIHRAATGTKWTGTVTLDWRAVRSKGALIGNRRVSQGVMSFLRQIDMGLAAQGRQGSDRPVTIIVPLWHREALEFIQARHALTPRIQVVVSVPDVFMERLRKRESWTMLDPGVFPEVLGAELDAYTRAEALVGQRRAQHPHAVQKMPADQVWRRLLTAMEQGSPFIVFEDAQRAFTPYPQSAPPVVGLDGVGALPLPLSHPGGRFTAVAWPSAAVNLAQALAADGTPNLEHLRRTSALALRMLDNALTASQPRDNQPTARYRPVCLGVVGYYEAIVRASAQMQQDPELSARWVSGLAEAWATVVVQADQQLARERGAAPAWKDSPDHQPFDPIESLARLQAQRQGAQSVALQPQQDWQALQAETARVGHRCSVRTIWAPFLGPAAVAGVTPGGSGSLAAFEEVLDDMGEWRRVPAPLLLLHARLRPEDMAEWRKPLRFPEQPHRWPALLAQWVQPDRETWETRLRHASLIRPWIDQGLSFTLPIGLPRDVLHQLAMKAWWLGLNTLRFAGPEPVEPTVPGADDEAAAEETP